MQLPKEIHRRLAEEFRFVAEKMNETAELPRKLYFFSAIYSSVSRTLNQIWNPELALLHMVTNATYMAIQNQPPIPVEFPRRLPDELTIATQKLAALFQQDTVESDDLYNLLARFAELAYVSTGNGRYLFTKGLINV